MTDINAQVDAFRQQLDGLDAVDQAVITSIAQDLALTFINAQKHQEVSTAVAELAYTYRDTPEVGSVVLLTAVAFYTGWITFEAPTFSLSGREGHLARVQSITLTARATGLAAKAGA